MTVITDTRGNNHHAKGTPASIGGQFAEKHRADAPDGLLVDHQPYVEDINRAALENGWGRAEWDAHAQATGTNPIRCTDCGFAMGDDADPDALFRCRACADDSNYYRCSRCARLVAANGEGYDGTCGACADEVDDDDEFVVPDSLSDIASREMAEADVNLDDIASLSGDGFGALRITLRTPHAGGFDTMICRTGEMVTFYRGTAIHRTDGPAIIRRGGHSDREDDSFDTYIDGRLFTAPENGYYFMGLDEDNSVLRWKSGSYEVLQSLVDGRRAWYYHDELHRLGGPAVECQVDEEQQWWTNGEQLPRPVPLAPKVKEVNGRSILEGSRYVEGRQVKEIASLIRSDLRLLARAGYLSQFANPRVRVRGTHINIQLPVADDYRIRDNEGTARLRAAVLRAAEAYSRADLPAGLNPGEPVREFRTSVSITKG